MSPTVAKLLKQYAISCVPKVAREKYPAMADQMQRLLKRWWNEMGHRERGKFRPIAERLGPLPDELKRKARAIGLIVEWPPPPKEKPKRRHDWSKPKSWRHERYGRRIR